MARRAMRRGAFRSRRASPASIKMISGPYGPSGVKAAMNLGGFKGGIPRRPLLPLTAAQVEEMRQVLIEEGLLP